MHASRPACGLRTRTIVVVIALVAAVWMLASCSEGPGGHRYDNQPPTAWLSSAPPEGNDTGYRVHLYWGGWDPDGEIGHYEYAITDNESGVFNPADTVTTPDYNPWHPVYSTDSVFTFSADVLRDTLTTSMVTRFERSHTFLIRAVDEAGLASTEPAYRSFTAWTLSPRVTIKVPRRSGQIRTPSLVTPVATYRWVAEDFVNTNLESKEPDSVRWILRRVKAEDFQGTIDYISTHPHSEDWSDWRYYRAPGDSGRFWTTPTTDIGSYVFAVQAKDEAGAVTPVFDETFNARRVRVATRTTGPNLEVTNEFTGPIRSAVANPPAVIIDMPAGVALQFAWSADADEYGGIVSGYRYGWDIADLSNPEEWETDYTPFTSSRATSPPRTFYFGTHTFDVEVKDDSGIRSRVEIKVNIIEFSMERSVLYVDDYEPVSKGIYVTHGAAPSDEEHDAFWEEMLGGVAGFSWDDDAITVKTNEAISIVRFASYKSIVWDALGGYNVYHLARPKLWDVIHYRPKTGGSGGDAAGKVQPNMLTLFMKAGGHLMVCGLQPMTQVMSRSFITKYPFIFKYELAGDQDGNYADQLQSGNPVGDQSFAFQEGCLNTIDLAYSGYSVMRDQLENKCGVKHIRNVDPIHDGMREGLPLDPAFPLLQLRPEVVGYGNAYAETAKGWNAEIYNPPYFDFCEPAEAGYRRSCFEPIYGNGCLNTTSAIYNAPVASWTGTYRYAVPDVLGGVAARSVILGFEPYYFNPRQVQGMMDVILFDEWQLPRREGSSVVDER